MSSRTHGKGYAQLIGCVRANLYTKMNDSIELSASQITRWAPRQELLPRSRNPAFYLPAKASAADFDRYKKVNMRRGGNPSTSL